jgi:CRP-like cAMP-binding protein
MKAQTAAASFRHEPPSRATPGAAVVPLRPEDDRHRRCFGAHMHLFRQGDDATRIYELISGEVMLYKLLPDGRRQVVELIGPGDVFGISAIPVYECSAETLTAGSATVHDRAFVEH